MSTSVSPYFFSNFFLAFFLNQNTDITWIWRHFSDETLQDVAENEIESNWNEVVDKLRTLARYHDVIHGGPDADMWRTQL